ncbi:MAG: HupE/UreJ family protein [Rhodospirillales bacterium]|jgi:hydrogenase/urease accessory protein HupE|nr:HupE/UreJ family protein [Rhodospirillales bacterium]
MQVVNRIVAIFGLMILSAAFTTTATAHKMRPAVALVMLHLDGTFSLEMRVNAEAILAGIDPGDKDTADSPNAAHYDQLRALPPKELEGRVMAFAPTLIQGLKLNFDDKSVAPTLISVRVPEVKDLGRARVSTLKFIGTIPVGAKIFRWSFAAKFGDSILVVKHAGEHKGLSNWLKEGKESNPFPISEKFIPKSTAQVAAEYVELGFTHIIPKGLDHILFVLGIYLLSSRLKAIVWQVTAFTVAHTITLGLTIYGLLSLPSYIVEPLISASIVYVAVENILTSEIKPWRIVLVFGFGLLHGMGFAGVLNEVGLPRSEFLTALITFNIGVELGQLSIIVAAFAATGLWFRHKPWYRKAIVIPSSVAIALVGVYWTVERTLV